MSVNPYESFSDDEQPHVPPSLVAVVLAVVIANAVIAVVFWWFAMRAPDPFAALLLFYGAILFGSCAIGVFVPLFRWMLGNTPWPFQ